MSGIKFKKYTLLCLQVSLLATFLFSLCNSLKLIHTSDPNLTHLRIERTINTIIVFIMLVEFPLCLKMFWHGKALLELNSKERKWGYNTFGDDSEVLGLISPSVDAIQNHKNPQFTTAVTFENHVNKPEETCKSKEFVGKHFSFVDFETPRRPFGRLASEFRSPAFLIILGSCKLVAFITQFAITLLSWLLDESVSSKGYFIPLVAVSASCGIGSALIVFLLNWYTSKLDRNTSSPTSLPTEC